MRLRPPRPQAATAIPLLSAYLTLAALYAWQAWERLTPTLFSDEIEMTQISRAVAETGTAALRGGEPAPGASAYAYALAPAWWLDDVSDAYGALKLIGVLVMTAAIFPAYALARLVVPRPWALLAAVATAAAPALSYSPFLVEEPAAYTSATLALWLIVRAGAAPTRWTVAAAVAACALAALVRSQLVILFVVLAAALFVRWWRTDRQRRWRAAWTRGDWIGAGVLAVGAAVAASAYVGHKSTSWYVATAFFKGRMLEYGLWAAGALTIGIGVLPLIATLAVLALPAAERRGTEVSFLVTAAAAIAAFGFYTAVKAAYLSTTFAIVVAERNLIYLCPVLFTGMALLLSRRRVPLPAIAAAAGVALYLVTSTPYTLTQYPNYEAHGLAIAAFANRILRWPDETIETALVLVTIVAATLLAVVVLAPWRRVALALAAAAGALVVGWSLTAEVYAANGERYASDRIYANLPKPPDWVVRATGAAPTIYVGQGIDPFAAWQVEFWNPNVKWFWGMDGTAPGPGARYTPDLLRPDGTQSPADLDAGYAVAVNGVAVAAPRVAEVGGAVLFRLDGAPVKLAQTTAGVSPDGWMAKLATFTRYAVGGARGVTVRFSRQGACNPERLKPVRVSARVGTVVVNEDRQPALGEVVDSGEATLAACTATAVFLRVPDGPWRVEANVDETFVPAELDPSSGDRRELGAVVGFEVVPG